MSEKWAEHTTCPDCGGALAFDPTAIGTTCGGLELEGWLFCDACSKGWISTRSKPVERWTMVRGGRSIDTGTTRLRAESGAGVEALMIRVARLPDLERALRRIAAGEGDAAAIAAGALK